jgi:hypothetical protein
MSSPSPEPSRFSIRSPRPLWIGAAVFVLIALAVAVLFKLPIAHRPLPNIEDIQSIEAIVDDTGGARVVFQVPRSHWHPIFSSLLPASRDADPAKWEVLGDLEIKLAGGDSFLVSLYSISDGLGAFSSGPTWEERVYYRGGSSADLEQALAEAFKVSEKGQ